MRAALVALAFLTIAFVPSASALMLRTPVVEELNVECKIVSTQMHTIRLKMRWLGPGTDSYEFKFTNAQGQHLRFYESVSAMGEGTFPLPAGNYVLTVSIVGRSDPNNPVLLPGTGQSVYRDIVVLTPVSTNGRGTGCRFSL